MSQPCPEHPCPRCGGPVDCAQRTGKKAACWCAELPHVMPMNPSADCLCRACLEKEIASRQAGKTDPSRP